MILRVAAGSSWWLFAAANLILFLYIAGGTVGIISGAVALLSRKGGRLHRIAGTVFLVAMLIMATIGAVTSPFLPRRADREIVEELRRFARGEAYDEQPMPGLGTSPQDPKRRYFISS